MRHALLSGLSSLLLPFGLYGAGAIAAPSYQRSYLSSSISASTDLLLRSDTSLPQDLIDLSGDQLDIQSAHPVRELVIVDGAVTEADKLVLRRALKPSVQLVELDSSIAGLPQLINVLDGHQNLAAIHVVSHAQAGAILLGNSRITPETIQREVQAFAALKGAVREGGDLLFYGCDLAANEAGEELLDIISNNTGLDVAASNNLTGNAELQGDWDLEITRGNIESTLAFSEKALRDFSGVLAPIVNGTYGFVGWSGQATAQLSTTHFRLTAKGGDGFTQNLASSIGNFAYMHGGETSTNHYFYLRADGTNTTAFELTGLTGGEAADPAYTAQFTNLRIVGYLQNGGTVTSSTVNGSGVKETFTFAPGQLASFSGVKLKGFKLFFDCASACNSSTDGPEFFEFYGFTVANAIDTPPSPTVSDARISISGATGTSGAYKIGDTVTATWNNTAGGDNNSGVTGVTVDFSQFGGGAAVTATDSSGTWTATYIITAGAIDLTARNVSVTATSAGGSDTTADSTNATIDSIAPTVTDGRISISGATGTAGAYKIGDTVTATWNNTAGGDNNTDTISPVTVNFSQFGGGAAVAATNSSGTWTATYTIVAGAIDATGRNISFSATDNAGNATTAADTTGATIDNIAPTLSGIALSGTPASTDSSMAFVASFSESVSNISTDDFTLATTSGTATGTIASVSAASGSSVNININGISGNGVFKLNLNGSTNIADDAGNAGIAAFSSGSTHTVAIPTAPTAPTIGTATAGDGQASVTFSAPGNNGGSAITTYTATASPGGAFGTCAGPAACTATVTGLSNGSAYTFTVTATNAIGTSTVSGASNSVTPKGAQTITFGNPGAQNFGTTPTLSATATSSLTPTFSSSTTGVCTITSGGALTFVTAGSCTIDADQAGNTAWNAATTVTQTFTVNAVVPGAPTIGTATAGDTQATVTFTGPANMGGAAIIASGYTVTASPGGATATGSSSPITVTGLTNGVAYTFSVTATNSAGEGGASAASNSVTPAAPQAITFNNPGTQNFGTTPTLTATSDAGGGYPVSFTSATTGVCTITAGGALTFVNVGSCTINADQAGDSSFLVAPQVSQTFTVAAVVPGAPTATAATAGDTQASVAFTAPVFTGGSAITSYTVTVNPADVAPIAGAASPIVVNGLTNGQAYTFTVTADNVVGTGPASPASNSITPAASQTITFAAPGAQSFGTTPTFTATADSGLTPTFTSSTTGVCTITSGGALTFVTIGNCTINADQAGNGSYLAAPQVTRTFAVNAVAPGAPTAAVATAGNASASVAFTAPVFAGGTGITGYTVTSNPGGITGSGAGSPIAVTGLSNGVAYTFTVTATNPTGTSSPSAASNAVTPNGAPTIGGTPTLSVAQDVAYSFIPSANDTVGDTLTFSITNKPSWAAFNAATGALTGTPTNADVGTTTGIIITVSDGTLSASLPAFNLEVTNVNEAPTITSTPLITTAQDVAYSYTLVAADSDVGDVLTLSAVTLPNWLNFNPASGVLSGTPTNANVGSHAVTVRVTDSGGLTVDQSFSITVTNVNDAPSISSSAITTATQDAAYSYTFAAIDSDVGDVLTLSVLTKPSWLSFNATSGVLSGTPGNADVGSHAVTLKVTDTDGLTAEQSFSITVTNVNDAPTISSTAMTSAAQNAAYSYTFAAIDSDIGDVLTLSALTKPSWLSFNAATGVLSGTPSNSDVGAHPVLLRVTDTDGLTAEQSFSIQVTNVNDAPTISSTAITTATQDAAYSYSFAATDTDVGDVLTFSAVTKPSWLSFNAATGVLSGTPSNADVGSHAVILRVSDTDGLTAEQSFSIQVTNVNDAPTISSTAITAATQDAAYSYSFVASDTDVGDVLIFSALTKPSWLSFNAATGLLSGTPSNADVGSHAVTLKVTDTDGLTAEQSFSITVTNVNDAPAISSTAITTATQDAAYSYSFAASDSDIGDVLTLSALTKPSWLSFNAATGVLSGTPSNSDVGSHAVTLKVTDTDGLTAEQSFSITVTNVNDAPIATGSTVTLEEDSSIMITLAAEDADSDPLTYEVVAQPGSGTLEQHGSVWLYTPEKDFNGTDSIGFIAKDAELSSEPATVTITVAPVNDDPQAVDDSYTLTSTPNDTYSLAVLANDVDVDGDTLSIDGAAADIGSVQIGDEGLIFTAPEAYVGPVALRYTISDGNKGRANATVNLLIEGAESDLQPVITLPDDVEVNATGLFTRVKLGFAKAVDRNGHPLPVSLVNKSLFFAPGNYLAYWQAVDRDGNKAIKAQKVKVNPLISLSKDQVVGEGNEVVVSVHLNGDAPTYPLSIPYTVSGSAGNADHDLVDGVVEVTSGQMAQIRFSTTEDAVVEGDEDVLITLDTGLNLGSKKQTQVWITEANIAPKVSLEVTQAGANQLIVAHDGGEVHIHTQVTDANMQDSLTLSWDSGSLSLQSDDAGMFFSPVAVQPGIYPVSLTATDNGLPALSTTEKVYIVVRPSLPVLTGVDTDDDLIPDDQEGFTDTDSDGVPDYLDANSDCSVMPEGELEPVYFLAEGQAGVCLRLGNIALRQGQSGVQLQPNAVAEDAVAANVGGIFDFIATGLPQQGQSYSLVLPQRAPIPANAVYRKFKTPIGWQDFVIDERNNVASTEGERGFCPPPGDSRWAPGLTEGHWCVQLTIEDGGPNDDDGVANRTIVDPSGVSVMLNGNHLPVANPDAASIPWNQSLDVNVLANDTDSDGDSLTVTQVISEFGTVTVLANQQISYMPATDFIGTDVLIYSITDGKGGTASSELTVIVNGNTTPITVNDSAATDDRTSLLLDVLSNDTDADGNMLSLVGASAQQGTVSVESNKLHYIPKTGFDGVDTVTYQVSDGLGGEASGQVLITVKAYQEVVIDNKSGGGSMSLWALALILAGGFMRRREWQKLALGALLLLSSIQQANASDWYVEGFIGQAQTDNGMQDLQPQVGAGVVTSIDNSDTAFGVSVGYQWTPTVAVELGYADFGEGSARIEGASLTPEQYHELVKTVTPVLADGVMLGLRFTLLQHEGWRFEVPVGLFHWQADISSTMGNTSLKTDLDGTDWYVGVRFSYQLTDAWSVGLGYQYVDIEPNDFLSSQFNLRYQF